MTKPKTPVSEPNPQEQGGNASTQKPRRKLHHEVHAMAKIDAILADLDAHAAQRVVAWAVGVTQERVLGEMRYVPASEPELVT